MIKVILLLLPMQTDPVVVTGYENGKEVQLLVQQVPGRDKRGNKLFLEPEARENFLDLMEAAAKDGHFIELNYAFRTMEQQRRLRAKSRFYADPPGLSSHQLGVAVDISGCINNRKATPLYRWLKKNAYKYGYFQLSHKEKWHWAYVSPDRR